jgi:hypothetical protein
MTLAFVPDCRRLVTRRWIDHSALEIGPMPFVTTKSADAIHGGRNAANARFAVTNSTGG